MNTDNGLRSFAASQGRKAVWWLMAIVVLALGLYFTIGLVAEHHVRKQLRSAAAELCATIDEDRPPVVTVTLFDRSVLIAGLSLLPSIDCSRSKLKVQGHIDTLRITGLSLTGLLFDRRASMDRLQVRVAEARVEMVPDSSRAIPDQRLKNEIKPWSINIGSFDVALRSTVFITQTGDTISARGQGIAVDGANLEYMTGQEEPLASWKGERVHLSADSTVAAMASGYAWSVGRCAFDQEHGTFELLGANIGPRLGLEEHSATLPFETDVIEARLETLQVAGFDMKTMFAEGVWSMRSVRLASGTVTVLRDKLLPNGQDTVKPLLGRSIRALSLGSGVDTISVDRLDVLYRERVDRQRGYAKIPFTHIRAIVTGARHSSSDTSALVVRAKAATFDSAAVSLFLRTVIADTTDRFELNASIGPMPFRAINAATGPLVDIRATEGRIDSVIYLMTADDRRGTGVVRMIYHGLKLESGGRKREQAGNQIESVLLNSLVRDSDRNKKGDARDGRFTVERRRDRRIFNYMWCGLREGVKAELLPEALTQ